LIKSRAMDSAVGTTIFSRGTPNFSGKIGRFFAGGAVGAGTGAVTGSVVPGIGTLIGAIGGGIAGGALAASQGAIDQITGEQQDFIAGVEQLISKEFLDSLINVKAQGATFGALQKAEQDALTNAASKIGFWRVESGSGEDKKVIGYNASEKAFTEELNKIKSIANLAYTRAAGKTLSPTEEAVLDSIYQQGEEFNPELYYGF